ncbi:MAG: RagB/SusD family nutrient uptake outer membrane protein [Prolixibacteraceae bacterium]|nr:RagB/SusD family nutrient uptake outer membrane protein [Prolixibacteraceae bacterium]
MNKRNIILGILLSTLMITSCVKDLDIKPKDPNTIMAGNLGDNPIYMKQTLGKIYASFMLSGQGSNGGDDIAASDGNFFTTSRALWNVQEITTDEAICGWGDVGISDLNTQTWSAQNPFLTALYQRLGLSITYANDFIRLTNGNTDPAVMQYNAEARFLRALAYAWYIDLFANPPFTTDVDGVGKFYPKQLDPDMKIGRAKLFNYIVSELKSIEPILGEPKFSYPQADKASAWMLLARVYLNAQVYTGTAKWDSCKIYTDKVISSGKYSLAANYRQNFSADNGKTNPEMIFALEQDGVNTQGYVGTTFLIESSSDARYIRAEDFHGLTSNTNWNGNRSRKQFMNVLVDTIATYGNVPVPANDTLFAQSKDKRVFLKMKKSMNIPSASSSGDYGIGVYKFTAKNSNGTQAANYNAAYASTDFPIFRYADALLMRAEASYRLGNIANAVTDINTIRERAFGNTTGNITAAQLNDKFLLDERGREFYYEAQRRTDLVRFGQFTDGTYRWQWKGGTFAGTATDKNLNVFPIPGDEVSANPNIKQNPGY